MFIDLFAGCGGFSLGLGKAGWRGLLAVEKDDWAFDTLQSNLIDGDHACYHDWPDWLEKKSHEIEILLKNHTPELKALRGEISILAGGPPCQGFSLAGRRNPKDSRNRLTEKYLKFVELVEPRYVVLENVRGFTAPFSNAEPGVDKTPYSVRVQQKLKGLGYKVFHDYVDCSDFGVPQRRKRFLMIGFREDCNNLSDDFAPFKILKEMRPEFLRSNGLSIRKVSVKEAIGDLEMERNVVESHPEWGNQGFKQITYTAPKKLNKYLSYCRKGLTNRIAPNSLRMARHKKTTIQNFKRIKAHSKPGVQLSKDSKKTLGIKKQVICALNPEHPSKTITTLPDDLIHYSELRILTVRENARIQSFPDNFSFKGNYTTGASRRAKECPRYTQVGNAVPPLLSQAIGQLLKSLQDS